MCAVANEKRRGVNDNNRGAGARSNAVRDKVRVERRIDLCVRRTGAVVAAGGHTVRSARRGPLACCTRASPSTNTSRAE